MNGKMLHMLQITVDLEALLRSMSALGLRWDPRQGELDVDYLVHAGLRRLFAEVAPQPFRVLPHPTHAGRRWVLGYGFEDASALAGKLAAAPGERRGIVIADGIRSRPMPERWRVGQRYRFEVRCCPVIRRSSDGPLTNAGRPAWRRGSEVDVFVARAGSDPKRNWTRQDVYREWLIDRLGDVVEVDPDEVRLTGFRLTPLIRGMASRDREGRRRFRRVPRRPDAVLRGTLEVREPDGFSRLLARGVGRHRAFGFGMLLLRPVVGE